MKNIFIQLRIFFFGVPHDKCRQKIRFLCWCRINGHTFLSKRLSANLQKYSIHISPQAEVHPSVVFPHPMNISIGVGAKVQADAVIFHGVTLGGRRVGSGISEGYPLVGRGATLYAGAVVIGPVKLGEECVVAANSVVEAHVENHTIVGGIPARPIARA